MCHDIAPSVEKRTCGNQCQHGWNLTFLAACFHRITPSGLFVPLTWGGNDLVHQCSWNESIILSMCVGNKLNNWKTIEDFQRRRRRRQQQHHHHHHHLHIKWLKNSTHEVLIFLAWQILLCGKCVKRALYTLIRRKTLLLSYYNVLDWKTSYMVSLY